MKIFYAESTKGVYRSDMHAVMPHDAVEISEEEYGQRFGKGSDLAPLTPAETEVAKIKAAESAVQTMLDAGANAKGYDGILSAASYAALPVGEPFQAEGAAFLLWRAKCWSKCYEILADVKSGNRPEPVLTELAAELPALVLP